MSDAAPLRVALFGSPAFALPSLEALSERHDLRLVLTQPDAPAGRGLQPTACAAAAWARERGVPLQQPRRLKANDEVFEALRGERLDVAVTAAYGKILPAEVLGIPRHGVLNVHASLLPAYRGAAPVQWALIDGCRETGVSIMQTETGLDTGPVRHVRRHRIRAEDDARSLTDALARLGAEALVEALDMLVAGSLPSVPQDDALASYAPRLTRDDGRVRWDDGAGRILDRHRGVIVWPGSWTTLGGDVVKIHDMVAGDDAARGADPDARPPHPGAVVAIDASGVRVATGTGTIVLREVQAPGRARLPAGAWARGARVREGVSLG